MFLDIKEIGINNDLDVFYDMFMDLDLTMDVRFSFKYDASKCGEYIRLKNVLNIKFYEKGMIFYFNSGNRHYYEYDLINEARIIVIE